VPLRDVLERPGEFLQLVDVLRVSVNSSGEPACLRPSSLLTIQVVVKSCQASGRASKAISCIRWVIRFPCSCKTGA
jgi:hypothetical protein